jgi:hypothetical protein
LSGGRLTPICQEPHVRVPQNCKALHGEIALLYSCVRAARVAVTLKSDAPCRSIDNNNKKERRRTCKINKTSANVIQSVFGRLQSTHHHAFNFPTTKLYTPTRSVRRNTDQNSTAGPIHASKLAHLEFRKLEILFVVSSQLLVTWGVHYYSAGKRGTIIG